MKLFCLALALMVVCATSSSEESTMERMERRMAEMEKELQKYRNMVAEVRASPHKNARWSVAARPFHVVCGPVSSLGACVFPRDMVRALARARAGG